ncbi:MAG: hypothetical protein JXB85_03590 [Anaerolineales bacterium]|nr:hypothetical protein [Anaerolineales bacterium]
MTPIPDALSPRGRFVQPAVFLFRACTGLGKSASRLLAPSLAVTGLLGLLSPSIRRLEEA